MTVSSVSVRLNVDGARVLLLTIDSEGNVRRGGRPSSAIVSGTLSPDVFAAVRRRISPKLLGWAGQSWSDSSRRGKRCCLSIGFTHEDGVETIMRWEYGSESQEPPAEVGDFVLSAVEASNPWYQRQLDERRAPSPWHLVPLESAP